MLKKILNEVSKFDLYFKEADEDENNGSVNVKVAPRANRGNDYTDSDTQVKVAPRTNRGTDYTEDDDNVDDDTTNDTENDVGNEPDNTTDTEPEEDTNNENDDTAEDDSTDYTEDDGDDTGNTPDTEDDDTGNEPDTDDDGATDYTQDDGGDDAGNQSDNAPPPEDKVQSADDRKKYNLYTRFLKVYAMISSFNDKIKNVVKDDPIQNAVLNRVSDNLDELYETMYEYMTVKFVTAKYIEAMIFFETVLGCIRLNFELIRNNKINLKQ